jgi:hypothetical protein
MQKLYYQAKKAEDKWMFERYTERARRVIFFARYEASQFGSTSIETEHMLLGILREDPNGMKRFMGDAIDAKHLGDEVADRLTVREKIRTSIDLPLSHECKRILAHAADEAENLKHFHIGVEHLLLGILREEKSAAAQVLATRGLSLPAVREEMARSAAPQNEPEGDLAERFRGVLSEEIQGLSFRGNVLPQGGVVPDAETAMRISEAVWIRQYGKETVEAQKPFHAEHKLTMWIVTGSAPSETALFAFILSHDCRVVSIGRGSAGS